MAQKIIQTRNHEAGIIRVSSSSSSINVDIIKSNENTNVETNGESIHAPDITSPSSSYHIDTFPEKLDHGFISNVVLCYWDNILGPKVSHVWNIGSELLNNHQLTHLCHQLLSGDVCKNIEDNFIDYKFLDLTELNIMLVGYGFIARGHNGLSVHSLACIVSKNYLKLYLEASSLMNKCLLQMIQKLRRYMHMATEDELMPENLSTQFIQFSQSCLRQLATLKSSSLAVPIKLADTFLCPSHLLERDFLSKCISSHLTTFGRSLIFGENHDRTNLLISTLALFNSREERRCSMLTADKQSQLGCHHDIWLQGIIRRKSHGNDLPVQQMIASKYPLTVINLTTRDVIQVFTSQHLRMYNPSVMMFNGELTHVPVGNSEEMVLNLLDELDKLPAECGVREAYISHFLMVLKRKALTLIKYLESETNFGSQLFKGGFKRIRQDLHIGSEGDLSIILATAEKMKEGLMYFLSGEAQWSASGQSDNFV